MCLCVCVCVCVYVCVRERERERARGAGPEGYHCGNGKRLHANAGAAASHLRVVAVRGSRRTGM